MMVKNYTQIFKFVILVSMILTFLNGYSLDMSMAMPTTNITEESTIEQIQSELQDMQVYVLEFVMENNEFPTFDKITPPEGCVGLSITNNEYVKGSLTIKYMGDVIYESGDYLKKESGVRVKIRGNTSAYGDDIKKKSYKIKLEKKADLLFRNDKNLMDKEWILLGAAADNLHYVAGFQLGRELGLGWQPSLRHVAVIMNDKYMGSYFLAESVKSSNGRVDMEDSGYIIENDPYWWKPDEIFFKSNHQLNAMGWTFKEPDTDDFDEMSIENIKWVINTIEDRLFNSNDAGELLDYPSIAKWLLAHDIMNSKDPLGSNIFLIKRDFDPLKPFESKVMMGPLWDLDAAFAVEEEEFSLLHVTPEFYVYKLITLPDFINIYEELWRSVRNGIKEPVLYHVKKYITENPDLNRLRLIDKQRDLLTKEEDVFEVYKYLGNWFDKRITILDKLILNESSIESLESSRDIQSNNKGQSTFFTINGMSANTNSKGVIISIDSKGDAVKYLK